MTTKILCIALLAMSTNCIAQEPKETDHNKKVTTRKKPAPAEDTTALPQTKINGKHLRGDGGRNVDKMQGKDPGIK